MCRSLFSTGTNGLMANNVLMSAILLNIQVIVTPLDPLKNNNFTTNGLVIHYYCPYQIKCNHLNMKHFIINFICMQKTCFNVGIQNIFYITKGNRASIVFLKVHLKICATLWPQSTTVTGTKLKHQCTIIKSSVLNCNFQNITTSSAIDFFVALVHDGALSHSGSTFYNNANNFSFVTKFDNKLSLPVLVCKFS